MTKTIEECSESTPLPIFFIKDGENKEPAYLDPNNGEFNIRNFTAKELTFIATDSCVYTSDDEKRCDCVVHDDKTFCFIELKNCKRTNWQNHREKAERQLETTIRNFEAENILNGKNLEAYMCCTCTINNEYTKIKRASNKSEIITYFEDSLNTSLYCDNQKEFK